MTEAQALRKVADRWQWGEWANAPRCADRVEERIANGQYVTDWLRACADEIDQKNSEPHINTKEENIAFRKDWDRRVDEGKQV